MEYNTLHNKISYITEKTIPSFFPHTFPSVYGYLSIAKQIIRCSRKVKKLDEANAWPIILRYISNIVTAFEKLGSVVHVENLHYTQRNTPVVILANHMSCLETVVTALFAGVTRKVSFVSKPEVIEYPFFKEIFRKLYPILIGRSNPREDFKTVLQQGKSVLEKGRNVVIFPQGTRNPFCVAEEFSSIGVKLAKTAEVPIVPLALKTDAWGLGKYIRNMGRIRSLPIRFTFFEPITIHSTTGKDEHIHCVKQICDQVHLWHKEDNTVQNTTY